MTKRWAFALLTLLIATATLAADLPPGKWWRRPEIAQSLGLTAEQQDKLENVWRAASGDLIDFKGEVEKQNIALRTELDRPALDRAAVLAFVLGGTVVYETVDVPKPAPPIIVNAQPKTQIEDPVVHDAWQSEELRDFHGMVQWETWDDTKTEARKGSSL